MNYQAKDTMTKELITIDWKADLTNAYSVMKQNKIRHLPVRNEDRVIIGMLSERDLLRAMRSEFTKDHLIPSEFMEFSPELVVRDYMSWPIKTVKKNDPIEKVAHQMLHEKISSVLVTDDDNELVGIVTTDDLIGFLLQLLQNDSGKGKMKIGDIFTSDWALM